MNTGAAHPGCSNSSCWGTGTLRSSKHISHASGWRGSQLLPHCPRESCPCFDNAAFTDMQAPVLSADFHDVTATWNYFGHFMSWYRMWGRRQMPPLLYRLNFQQLASSIEAVYFHIPSCCFSSLRKNSDLQPCDLLTLVNRHAGTPAGTPQPAGHPLPHPT